MPYSHVVAEAAEADAGVIAAAGAFVVAGVVFAAGETIAAATAIADKQINNCGVLHPAF